MKLGFGRIMTRWKRKMDFTGETHWLRGAGAYQIYSGTSRPEWGKPCGDSPYSDDPNDYQWINEGIKDYESSK